MARPGKREEGGSDRGRETGTDRRDRREWGTKKGRELQKEVVVLFDVTPDPVGQGCCTAVPLEKESLSRPVISCLVGAGKGGQLALGW